MDVQINIVVKQPHVMTNILSLKINKNLDIVYKLKEITQEDVACIPLISGRGKAVRNEYFICVLYIKCWKNQSNENFLLKNTR